VVVAFILMHKSEYLKERFQLQPNLLLLAQPGKRTSLVEEDDTNSDTTARLEIIEAEEGEPQRHLPTDVEDSPPPHDTLGKKIN